MIISYIILTVLIAILIYMSITSTKRIEVLRKEANDWQNKIVSYSNKEIQLQQSIVQLDDKQRKIRSHVTYLEQRKSDLTNDISASAQQAEQLKQSYELAEEQYRRNYMNERKDWVEARQEEYLQMQEDFVKQFREENRKKLDAAQQLEQTLTTLREKVSAATALEKARAADENYE